MRSVRRTIRDTLRRVTTEIADRGNAPLRAQVDTATRALSRERTSRRHDCEALRSPALAERAARAVWAAEFAGSPPDPWDALSEEDKALRRALASAALAEAHAELTARARHSDDTEA